MGGPEVWFEREIFGCCSYISWTVAVIVLFLLAQPVSMHDGIVMTLCMITNIVLEAWKWHNISYQSGLRCCMFILYFWIACTVVFQVGQLTWCKKLWKLVLQCFHSFSLALTYWTFMMPTCMWSFASCALKDFISVFAWLYFMLLSAFTTSCLSGAYFCYVAICLAVEALLYLAL